MPNKRSVDSVQSCVDSLVFPLATEIDICILSQGLMKTESPKILLQYVIQSRVIHASTVVIVRSDITRAVRQAHQCSYSIALCPLI